MYSIGLPYPPNQKFLFNPSAKFLATALAKHKNFILNYKYFEVKGSCTNVDFFGMFGGIFVNYWLSHRRETLSSKKE